MNIQPLNQMSLLPLALMLLMCEAACAETKPAFGSPAPENATPEQILSDVRVWISLADPLGPHVNPVGYGVRAFPAIRVVLENPNDHVDHQIAGALQLLASIDIIRPDLLNSVEPYLASEKLSVRTAAVRAAIAIHSQIGATLISLMYDDASSVRGAAFVGLARRGGSDELLALRIWRQHVEAADLSRELEDKWLTSAVQRRYEQTIEAIENRIRNTETGGDVDGTDTFLEPDRLAE